MFEQAPVVQMQIEFGVGLVGRFCRREREQPGFAIREGKLLRIEQRLIRSVCCNRPLEGTKSLEPLVGHACEQGCQRSDLAIDFGWMLVVPVCSEAIGKVLDDSPVWPAAFQRFEYLVEPLDSPFCARERTLFFKTWTRSEEHTSE